MPGPGVHPQQHRTGTTLAALQLGASEDAQENSRLNLVDVATSSVALAVNDLATRGSAIEAGWIVLTGGMSDAVFATPGSTVSCRFAHLGDVALECGKPD